MTKEERENIQAAMLVLQWCPSGDIGKNGPTLSEMDEVHGDCKHWEDDIVYDFAQYAWRLLEAVVAD
jgi:hypothetical protein